MAQRWERKKSGSDEIVYVSSGEGATSEGEFFEALNWSNREKFPIIFLIQNNHFAISVPFKDQVAGNSLYDLTSGYNNFLRIQVDGTDFVKSYEASLKAVEYARSGKGPVLIEADCVRLFPHSSSDDQKNIAMPMKSKMKKTRSNSAIRKIFNRK